MWGSHNLQYGPVFDIFFLSQTCQITELKWLANTVSDFKSQIKFCRKTCFLWLPEISFSNFPSCIDNPTFESVIQERYRITQRGIIQSNCCVDTEGDIGDGLLVAWWGGSPYRSWEVFEKQPLRGHRSVGYVSGDPHKGPEERSIQPETHRLVLRAGLGPSAL